MRGVACSLLAALVVLAPVPVAPADPESPAPVEIVSPSSVGEVVFPHQKHFEELSIGCGDCHHETSAAVLKMPHPQYFEDFWIDCAVCHREDDAPLASLSCSSCHPSAPTSIADQTLSAKVAIHRSCWRCHETGSGESATASCAQCHNRERIAASASAGGENR